MDMFQSIKTCMRKSFVFKGRASRSEYWWFIFAYAVTWVLSVFVYNIIFNDGETAAQLTFEYVFLGVFTVGLIPLLSSGSRRLHDVGLSGWWQILPLVALVLAYFTLILGMNFEGLFPLLVKLLLLATPVLALILLVFWLSKRGDIESNKFGHTPI